MPDLYREEVVAKLNWLARVHEACWTTPAKEGVMKDYLELYQRYIVPACPVVVVMV